MTGFKSENVELEALPVASSVLNNFKEGGVSVVEVIEYDGKPSTLGSCMKNLATRSSLQIGFSCE